MHVKGQLSRQWLKMQSGLKQKTSNRVVAYLIAILFLITRLDHKAMFDLIKTLSWFKSF